MARGRDKHQAHQDAVNALGRGLSRRARSRCELCEAEGVPLKVIEVEGNPHDAPDEDWAMLLCERCQGLMAGGKVDPSTLRFLEGVMWSEIQPVQITAVRLLRGLDTVWAREAVEGLYLDPEIEALV